MAPGFLKRLSLQKASRWSAPHYLPYNRPSLAGGKKNVSIVRGRRFLKKGLVAAAFKKFEAKEAFRAEKQLDALPFENASSAALMQKAK
jgi:hypothetical protein